VVLTQLITNFGLDAVMITHFDDRWPSKAYVLRDLLHIQDVPDWITIHGFMVPTTRGDNQGHDFFISIPSICRRRPASTEGVNKPQRTNMAQTKSPNCQGKKKQSTQQFTKEKTTPLLPTKLTSKLPPHHRLNGKKAKTTGTTPPCNMDEDELDLTQVNMDIGVEVNPEEVAPGTQVMVAANNGETNVATRAIVVAGEAGTQAAEVTRDELTRVVLAAGSQDTKATPIRGRNLEGQFNKPNTHKLKGIKVAASGIFPELAADDKGITSLQCGKHNLQTLISTHSGTWFKLVARTTTVLVIGDKPGKIKVDKSDEL
jgi:hypothetical protein